MNTLTTTIFINRPAEEVFGWLTNFANHMQWQPNLVEASGEYPDRVGVTAIYRHVAEVMVHFPSTGEVRAGGKSHGGLVQIETIYQFEQTGSSTKMTATINTPTSSFPNANGLVKQQLKQSLDEQNARLKQILEN